MFEARLAGDRMQLIGRLDASQVEVAREAMNRINTSSVIDFGELEYISSAGLGMLLGIQKRLMETGGTLKLINMNRHIREIFRMAGFDRIFVIE
jgi:anti-sigma B factor antagonist